MGKLDGRCLCGAMTYTCDAEPLFQAVCHCRNCQRQTGSAFSIVVGAPEAAFQLHGDVAKSIVTPGEDTGAENERFFCGECGSPLYTSSPAIPGVLVVKAGTLDDPSWLEPQLEIWGSSAQEWVERVESRPRLDRGPQRAA